MNMKRILSLILAVLMVASVLCACQPETPESSTANYKVTILAPDGKPMSTGVAVRFKQGGAQVAMQVVNADGVAAKELNKGEYTVELAFTSETEYAYDLVNVNLTATKTELEIHLLNLVGKRGPQLSVPVGEPNEFGMVENKEYSSYNVTVGRTELDLTAGDRTFFIFAPQKSGIYYFTMENSQATVGYYGDPNVVLRMNVGTPVEGMENVIAVTVQEGSVGSPHVLGIEAPEGVNGGILNISYAGELPPEIPFTIYQMKATDLKPYVHPADAVVADFNLNSTYNLVFNEADGYYHLDSKDGPLVLVHMGHNADGDMKYMSSVYTTTRTSSFYRFYYDAEGNLTQKLGFMECLSKYLECVIPDDTGRGGNPSSYTYVDHASGLYPLTEDLKFILQETGAQNGWWDKESYGYLFVDDFGNLEEVNPETAWLFYCCYIAN